MRSTFILTLAILLSILHSAHSMWVFRIGRPLASGRLDPIVSPGTVASHVHNIAGASNFGANATVSDLLKSNCTTIPVQPDLSNYWVPALYAQTDKGFKLLNSYSNIYYQNRAFNYGGKASDNNRTAFPLGFKMLAGDPKRHTFNSSQQDFAGRAISFVCLLEGGKQGPSEQNTLNFGIDCTFGLRAQVYFPSCWDGVNLDSPDHKSHVSYPMDNYNVGQCPKTHPVALQSLFIETMFNVKGQNPANLIFASGDKTGLGFHGDFFSGWDETLLQKAINDCTTVDQGIDVCVHFKKWNSVSQPTIPACKPSGLYPAEDIGLDAPIASLPGCNLPWPASVAEKPQCAITTSTPPISRVLGPIIPAGWSYAGCMAEPTNSRLLVGAEYKANSSNTNEGCISFCISKGFRFAGTEYGAECYCSNSLTTGSSTSTAVCDMPCAGKNSDLCGGSRTVSVFAQSAKSARHIAVSGDGGSDAASGGELTAALNLSGKFSARLARNRYRLH